MDCRVPGFPVHYFLEFAQIHVHWIGDAIQPFHPLTPFSACSVFPGIEMFFNELVLCIRRPKYWSFRISASDEFSELISSRIGWFDISCCPGDFQEASPAPQFESINSLSLSPLYGPTLTPVHDYPKDHSLTIWTFVSKVMFLLCNKLSSFVSAFLPNSRCLLIFWLQPLSTVILETKKTKSVIVSTFVCP